MFNIGVLGFCLCCCNLLIQASTDSDTNEPANLLRTSPVSDNPRIVEHPQDDFFAKNEPATLNCKAEGDPTPSITWYKDGERVETNRDDPLSHRMLLDKGQLFFLRVIHSKNNHQDIGEYYCNATNSHGSAISRIANIQIAVLKDTFVDEPSDTTTAVGQRVILHCRPPRGKPPPKVIWRKNSELVQTDDRVQITEEGDLEISSVEKKDIGEYLCLAINTGGERQSKPAQLRVLDVPIFHKLPKDVSVEEGDIAEFFCEVIGDPPIKVVWSKESGAISFGRARVLSDRTLRIENVEPSDEGLYICSAENAAGSTQATARLIVYSSPSFLIRPRDQVVARGRTVTLQCIAKGNPPPTIYWKEESRDQLMFPHRDYGRISVTEEGSLRIQAVMDSDAGTYICDALNTKGQSSASAFLKVIAESSFPLPAHDTRPPPIIKIGPQNQTLPVGSTAILQCLADGKPEPITRWTKNNRPLLMSDPRYLVTENNELQISDLKMQDTGSYTCKAMSETGETTWEAFLAVTSDPSSQAAVMSAAVSLLPDPPTKPVVSDVTDTSVHLSWSPGIQTGQEPVTSFYVEYFGFETTDGWVTASKNVKRESYTVDNLRPNITYMFLVRAVNMYGVGYPSLLSESVKMMGNRPKHEKPKLTQADIKKLLSGVVVEMVNTHSVNSSAISLTWKGTKADDIIEGYQIEYTHILDIMRLTYGETRKIRVPPTVTTYLVTGLNTYSWYQLRVLAYSGNVQSQYSSPIKVQTEEFYQAGPPKDVTIHRISDDSISVLWSPPDMRLRQFHVTGYQVSCVSADGRENCSTSTNGRTKNTVIKRLNPHTVYRVKVAAETPQGIGEWSEVYAVDSDGIHMVLDTHQASTVKPVAEEESEEEDLFKRSWFVGLLIGVGGVMLWLLLCIFSIWLCKRKKHRKKMKDQRFYSGVPIRKGEECNRNMMYPPQYGIKDGTMNCTNDLDLPPELRGLLPSHAKKESEGHDDNIYKVAGDGSFPELKTFYQKVDPVAPYATTALIQQQHLMKQRQQQQGIENMFRPINQGYIQHSEGSADSCVKPPVSSDSNHDTSHHSHSTTDHNHSDHMSPTSDSGSHSTDDNGLLIKQKKKNNSKKETSSNKQQPVNWVEMLPPPPEHPPPSECGEPPSYNELRDTRGNARSPMSPASFSALSACSCPNPHTQTPVSGWNMPVYSDNECPRCHSEKYYDPNAYCQDPYIRRTQSPRTQLLQHVNKQTMSGAPHNMCSPRETPCGNVQFQYAQSQRGPHSNCATPYSDYSKSNINRTSQGSHSDNDGQCQVPCFQSYKITPKSDTDYRFMHEEWGPDPAPPCHNCEQDSGMGMEEDGPGMERGCQSSLPGHGTGEHGNNSLYPSRQMMSSNVHGYNQRNCDSPISEGADYGADSDLDHSQEQPTFTGPADQHTDCSSVQSSTCSSGDGTFLTEEDFASAVARAAEMSGLTVVGTTVCDPNNKSKKERRPRRQARPVSPGYSTDSNYGSIDVVRKPYPKSARKQQLIEQGKGKYNLPPNGMENINKSSNMDNMTGVYDTPYARTDYPMTVSQQHAYPYPARFASLGRNTTLNNNNRMSPLDGSIRGGSEKGGYASFVYPQNIAQIQLKEDIV